MKCDTCGEEITIGCWPWCGGINDHGKPETRKAMEPYFDVALGAQISNPGDRNKLMRPRWDNDQYIHIVPRDLPSSHYKEVAEKRAERREQTRKEGRI